MNESIERRLEVLVARAVRPVWASRSRKQLMHEEMLAHVAAVFDEEMARLGDERVAFNETRRRFGLGEKLESELQESVPWLERLLLISEREILMSRWFWMAEVAAVFFGPAILLPAMAKLRDHGVMLWVPFSLGLLITLAGVGGIGYGIVRRFANST